jgi:hypothetical protein
MQTSAILCCMHCHCHCDPHDIPCTACSVPCWMCDRGTSESDHTLSSGLSPRDTKPRRREFDVEAAKNVSSEVLGRPRMCMLCVMPRVALFLLLRCQQVATGCLGPYKHRVFAQTG